MLPISPYQIQEPGHIQYTVQKQQQAQPIKVLSSALIPQQQSYDPSSSLQNQFAQYKVRNNSMNLGSNKSFISHTSPSLGPQQVIQQSIQPSQAQTFVQGQYLGNNGQSAKTIKTQFNERINETNDDNKFRLSNISSISHNGSIYSHSRRASERITPNITQQAVQSGGQVINPLGTYYSYQRLNDKQIELQNKQPQSINQTYISYQKAEDNEARLQMLIKENEQLLKENEHFRLRLQGLPREQQSNITLQQQVQQLNYLVESLQSQLQIQRDETTMWQNREKEMNDRCRSLYDQLQSVKGSDSSFLVNANGLSKQKISSLDTTNLHLQRKSDEFINPSFQVQKDSSYKPLANFGTSSQPTLTKVSSTHGLTTEYSYKDKKNTIDEYIPFKKSYQSYNSPVETASQGGNSTNNHLYSSPQQREDKIQSIINEYKQRSGSISGTPNKYQ